MRLKMLEMNDARQLRMHSVSINKYIKLKSLWIWFVLLFAKYNGHEKKWLASKRLPTYQFHSLNEIEYDTLYIIINIWILDVLEWDVTNPVRPINLIKRKKKGFFFYIDIR